jgi:hypothetical protein
MTTFDERIAALPERHRMLLERRLLEKGLPVPGEQVEGPLSPAQERLWFLDRMAGGNSAYHVRSAVRIEGPLDAHRLAQCLCKVALRHGAFRTRFETRDGQPVQVIDRTSAFDVPVVDVPRDEVHTFCLDLLTRPFDLGEAPLARAAVVRVDPQEHVLVLVAHHIVADGWSVNVIQHELAEQYADPERPLPRPAVTFVDFARWQRRSVPADDLAYWRDHLSGVDPVLVLPADAPRPPVQTFRGALHTFQWDDVLSARIHDTAREAESTIFMVLLAAYAIVLTAHAERDDVVIGSPASGRGRSEFESVVGLFATMLPLRVTVDSSEDFHGLVRRVKADCLAGVAHQDCPLERIVEDLRLPRDPSRQPLFQAVLVMQNVSRRQAALPGLVTSRVDVDSGTAKFDLVLDISQPGPRIAGAWEYNRDLFGADRVAGMAGDLRVVLESPHRPVRELRELVLSRARERDRHRAGRLRETNRELLGGRIVSSLKAGPRAGAARRAVRVTGELVHAEPMFPDRPMPLVITPSIRGVNLTEWVTDNKVWFHEQLAVHGAVLFRDFAVGVEEFERFMLAAGDGELLSDPARYDLPGPKDQVYVTTNYPAQHEIFLHNETWWQYSWPKKIYFCGQVVPERGGATTFADTRRVLARMDPAIVERFAGGVMHVRNSGSRVGLRPWQNVFGTTDRAEVERFCRANEVEFEWQDDDVVTTRHWRPAFLDHPVTGERLWFNHAAHSHLSTNVTADMAAAVAGLDPSEVPTNVLYANGDPIPAEDMEVIRAAYRAETVVVPWEPGNVLVLDNMIAAHGREAYEGDRKVLVGMTELTGWPKNQGEW